MIIHEKLFYVVILNVAFSGRETREPLFQFLSVAIFLPMCWRRVSVTQFFIATITNYHI